MRYILALHVILMSTVWAKFGQSDCPQNSFYTECPDNIAGMDCACCLDINSKAPRKKFPCNGYGL
ncbi:hypothetical protein PGT21_030482 [Puccinia graminis f. sp. tritici]|uniref:Secreted protein n=1 Tax=Puccinia graminis f. sp. tritici TaxID=56615 RepID=A0A5B0QCL4_PUCGR|nr:hypothetical protein PGT21_030482 [Puccinia graminis f. sp. tritici]